MMKQLLIVGMPNSGKSTFIGALRHLLMAKEVATELELTVLSSSEKHLNNLESKWIACDPVGRTKVSDETWVELNLKNVRTGEESAIQLPDLRGETFEMPAASSKCHNEFHEALVQSDAILLFTNADREDDNLLIDDLLDMFEADDRGDDASLAVTEGVGASEVRRLQLSDEAKFIPEKMPEEAKIVELLQLANRKPQQARCRKIAILISAWDVIQGAQASPAEWLRENRPMLSQFLANNPEEWNLRVYGVSAQGGKLPDQKEQLKQIKVPTERIRIVGHEAGEHDLTAPVRWSMSG